MANIMTELEFRNQTELSEDIISSWVQSSVIRPVEVNGGKYFLPKHIRLVSGIRELESRNVEHDVIFGHIQNEVLDVEAVLNTMNVNHRNLDYYQGLSFEELTAEARTERITGFRTMTREELEICLSQPEQRADIIATVRERNRLAREARANAQNEEVEATTSEETVAPANDYSEMNYKDLVLMARDNAIPNFRRMTKEELIIVNFGTSDEIDQVIIDVRERTRNRYGAGSQNQEVDQMDLGEFYEELDGVVEDPNFYEEPFISFDEEFEEDASENTGESTEITVEPTVEEETPVTIVEPTVEETVTEENAPVATNNDIVEPQVFVMPEGEWVTDEVPYTFAQLQALNSKQLAVVVRDHCPVKYFRRMTKDELLICIFQPERRGDMSANALLRYERYRGNRYGSNR